MNFSRRDRPAETPDPRNPGRPGLRPAIYEPPGTSAVPASASAAVQPLPPDPTQVRERPTVQSTASRTENPHTGHARADTHVGAHRSDSLHAGAHVGAASAQQNAPEEAPASRLFVGLNVKLKGVEIDDCDLLIVEGRVEATVHSKAMEISKPGTLQGTVEVDVAEIHGDFSGELTARTRLVVHGTGRVAGTIRYGRLVVAEGGTITGDVKELGAAETPAAAAAAPRRAASETRTAS